MIDADFWPHQRDERCANCNKYWVRHNGWYCGSVGDSGWDYHRGLKSKLSTHQRYLTSDMPEFYLPIALPRTDETPTLPIIKSARAISEDKSDDWHAWAHSKVGDCPCGIKKEVCKYHS